MSYRQLSEGLDIRLLYCSQRGIHNEILQKSLTLRPRPSMESCDVTTMRVGIITLDKLKSAR